MAIISVHQSWITIGPDQGEVFSFDPFPAAIFLPEQSTEHGFTNHALHIEPSVEWQIEVDETPGVQVAEDGTKYVPEPGSPEDRLTAFAVAIRTRYGWTGYRFIIDPQHRPTTQSS
jgi:hypothetical protein